MKSLIKRSLRAAWRALAPLRRPITRRVGARLAAFLEATVRPMVVEEIERRVRPSLDAATSVARENLERTDDVVQFLRRSAQEDTLLLDSLVRELTRLQLQVEALRPIVDDRDGTPEGDSAAERLMIGGPSGR